MATSVQFKGKDKILEVFDNKALPLWSLWQGSQFLEKGEGRASLENLLSMIDGDGSKAAYTLRLYESGAIGAIKSRTDFDASYNFSLNEGGYDGGGSSVGAAIARERKIWDLERKIDELEKKEAVPKFNMIGFIQEAASDPIKLGQYINLIKGIFGGGAMPSVSGVRNIATFTEEPAHQFQENFQTAGMPDKKNNSEDIVERAQVALDILDKHDPDLVSHLEKLANLAERDPKKFKSLLGTIDLML